MTAESAAAPKVRVAIVDDHESVRLGVAAAIEAAGMQVVPSAEIAAVSTSETISRKAMPRIIPNDSKRARSSFHQPAERSRAGARQIRSSASCSSPNTVVAPISRRTMPMVVAAAPSAGLLTLASRLSIALAASAPISPATWPGY